jgi:hypothetical protein
MSSEEFAKICFALRPVLIVAAVMAGGIVLIHVWNARERRIAGQQQQAQ